MSATRVQPELAIKDLTSVIDEDPSILMARRTRAVAYAAAGRHDLAIGDIRALEKISELTPDDEIMLGDNLRQTGQYQEAARVLAESVPPVVPAAPAPVPHPVPQAVPQPEPPTTAAACMTILPS